MREAESDPEIRDCDDRLRRAGYVTAEGAGAAGRYVSADRRGDDRPFVLAHGTTRREAWARCARLAGV